MKFHKIRSYAKINLSLGVLGKLKSRIHKIESIVSFIDLHDEIFIREHKQDNHKIIFLGKFSKGIQKNNTISKLLNILDLKKKLNNKKYFIKVKKNIPQKSGMGGGSMNASSVLKYLLTNTKLELSSKEIIRITRKIGSDVIFGMQKSPSIFFGNSNFKHLKYKFSYELLIIKPHFGCSTKDIYKNVKNYSKTIFKKKKFIKFNRLFLSNLKNDLENSAFKKYPKLERMKSYMQNLNKILFIRMTGSGSALVCYFGSKNAAINAQKILKKKYKKYWCILSKTI